MVKENTCVVEGVELFRWAPRAPFPLRPRRYFKWTKRLPFAPVVRNFGDLLSEDIVRYIVSSRRLKPLNFSTVSSPKRLLGVGSIIHFAMPGDVVWGSGVNGKHLDDLTRVEDVIFSAVRGPLSRDILLNIGYDVPEIYGDPGLLAPQVFKKDLLLDVSASTRKVALIPNLNDLPLWQQTWETLGKGYELISPIGAPQDIIKKIVNSEAVVTSSLHGFILAEAYGIPRALVSSAAEPIFKYEDYYTGTGRSDLNFYPTIQQGIENISDNFFEFDSKYLLNSFPSNLWSGN